MDPGEHVLEQPNAIQNVQYEQRVATCGYIDALFTDARLLVERKKSGTDLDAPETRQSS